MRTGSSGPRIAGARSREAQRARVSAAIEHARKNPEMTYADVARVFRVPSSKLTEALGPSASARTPLAEGEIRCTPGQRRALRALLAGPLDVPAVGRALGIYLQGANLMLRGLARRGVVERAPSVDGKQRWQLTDRGQAIAEAP